MDNNGLITEFDFFFKLWFWFKSEAKAQNDYEIYNLFLKEAKRVLSGVYILIEDKDLIKFLTEVMQLISCEIKENNIKYKKEKMPF